MNYNHILFLSRSCGIIVIISVDSTDTKEILGVLCELIAPTPKSFPHLFMFFFTTGPALDFHLHQTTNTA